MAKIPRLERVKEEFHHEEFHHREGRFAAIKSPGTAGHEEHEERKKND
jgi:hypothetical protein